MKNETINFLVDQLKTLVTTALKILRVNKYSVEVKNFPGTQAVKGTVIVGNQGRLEELLKKFVNKEVTAKEIIVENVQGPMKVVFPKEWRVSNLSEIKFPPAIPFPESFRVSNPQKNVTVDNLDIVKSAVLEVLQAVNKLKLDPKIEVKPPSITLTPTPITIPQMKEMKLDLEKLKSSNPKEYVPVRLTDGKEFYEALLSVSRSLNRAISVSNMDPLSVYQVADKDTAGTTNYYGFTDKDENWYIMVEDETAETYRYIKGSGEYSTNWTGRAGLTYDYFHNIF